MLLLTTAGQQLPFSSFVEIPVVKDNGDKIIIPMYNSFNPKYFGGGIVICVNAAITLQSHRFHFIYTINISRKYCSI